jgi:GT2 family glycosyltransferase
MIVSPAMSKRDRIVLAISTYRGDDAVLALLAQVHQAQGPRFRAVVVVDSLGDGSLAAAIARAGYDVDYRNAAVNLGAAGNHEARMRAAAEYDADYVYALNHDGVFDLHVIDVLYAHARAWPKLGAVYPTRRYVNRGGRLDLSVARPGVLGTLLGTSREPPRGAIPVPWSSSNGALYSLAPTRAGVLPWPALFMGYEDLDYCWSLAAAGYEQHMLGDVIIDDPYEYRRHALGPFGFYASEKPSWYAYYFARNLVVVSKRHGRGGPSVAARIGLELLLTLSVRRDKRARLWGLAEGLRDARRGTLGKARLP